MIPDSPQEADEEAIKYMEPVMIPLNDVCLLVTIFTYQQTNKCSFQSETFLFVSIK